MFKKFQGKESISNISQVKSSKQRGIVKAILTQYPSLEPHMEDILPKKSPLFEAKCKDMNVNLIVMNSEPLFFSIHDGPFFPCLRLLHKYPKILPQLQVDRGAVKFIMDGAHIMCPGLTSPGGKMDIDVDANSNVAVIVEGKEHAIAVGTTKMSTNDIRTINSGIGIENIHYLGDGLFMTEKID